MQRLKRFQWERTKTFEHDLITFPELEHHDGANGRFYETPIGKLPSVTTVLSEYSKEGLDRWKQFVGEAKAEQIKSDAAFRGRHIHKLAEKYLLNQDLNDESRYFLDQFGRLQPVIDKYITQVNVLEAALWSPTLRVAGRTDCIGLWEGTPAIIDFKTSLKLKTKSMIKNYFMQAACYAHMFEEMTGINIETCVILITVDGTDPQIFVENRYDHIRDFLDLRESFKEKYQC